VQSREQRCIRKPSLPDKGAHDGVPGSFASGARK
jgi:hypothetical protein